MELNAKMPEGCLKSVIVSSIRERIMFNDFKNERGDFNISHVSKVEGSESWDIIYQSGQTNNICECKVRDKMLEWHDNEGWIIEEYKYNKLKQLQQSARNKGNDMRIIYANIFRNAVVIWDLDNVQLNFFERDSKTMTMEDAGRKIKRVAYLTSSQGTTYRYTQNPKKKLAEADRIFYFLFPGEL